MFSDSSRPWRRVLRAIIFCLAACWLFPAPRAQAGLTFNAHLSHFNANGTNYYYTISAGLTTNSAAPAAPFGDYYLVSPGYPGTHGTDQHFHYDSTNGFGFTGGGSFFYGDFASVMNAITNNNWTLFVTNLAGNSTTTYTFHITAPTLSSNDIPNVFVTYPLNGTTNNDTQPTFTWVGGSLNYDGEDIRLDSANDNSVHHEVLTAVSVNSWQFPSVTLSPNTYNFNIDYNVSSNSAMVASTPTNGPTPISSWTSTATLDTSFQSQFTIPQPPATNTTSLGHVLVLHYTWDGSFPDSLSASVDSSGFGNNAGFATGTGGGGVTLTPTAVEGGQAVQYHDPDGSNLGALGVLAPSSAIDALAGSFTVSCWIKTTQTFASDNSFAFDGAGIVAADVSGLHNDAVPIALTGSKIGFNTGGASDQTINSTNSVNDGNYHLVTVTRDQVSGTKSIYIDGVLDTTGSGTTNLLNDPQLLSFGAQINAASANLGSAAFHNGFDGEMDDLQIYSGILNPAEVAYLFQHPGTPAPNLSGNSLVAHYTFDDPNFIGTDSSGNDFHLDYNGDDGVVATSDSKAGANAADFDGGAYLAYNTPPTNVLAAFAGDFTLAVWVRTDQTYGNDNDPAFEDGGIVAADIPGQHNDIIPMALTGGAIGFNTGGDFDDTVNSSVDINNSQYHQVVVTRSRATGQKQIYIDGVLNTNDFGATNLLNDPVSIGIGTGIDASQTDPSQISNNQFYQGQMDDMQVYSRVLNANEIAYLFNNPGQPVTSGIAPPAFTGTVTLNMSIYRANDPANGDEFFAFPGLNVDQTPTTFDEVTSPTHLFSSTFSPTNSGSGSTVFGSLDDLVNECTNGFWTLTINENSTNQQIFHFSVSVSGLTSNLLTRVTILAPTNGGVNIPPNTPFQWTGGPAGFASSNSTLTISKEVFGGANKVVLTPALSATSWPSPPVLDTGTNQFDVDYTAVNVTNLTFTLPMDASSHVISNLVTQVSLNDTAEAIFTVTASPTPFTLGHAQINGTNFQFSFQSQSGFTNRVQYITNLTSTNWLTYTNVPGDGSVKTLLVPLSIFGSSRQGFVRIHP